MSRKRVRLTESLPSASYFIPPSLCFAPKRPRLPSRYNPTGEKNMGVDLFGVLAQLKSKPARPLFGVVGAHSASDSTFYSTLDRRLSLFSDQENCKEEGSVFL
jgi:hypothetical protein